MNNTEPKYSELAREALNHIKKPCSNIYCEKAMCNSMVQDFWSLYGEITRKALEAMASRDKYKLEDREPFLADDE